MTTTTLKATQLAVGTATNVGESRLPLVKRLQKIREAIALWHARARQRRVLGELSPELLSDIGVTAQQAAEEARKLPWRA